MRLDINRIIIDAGMKQTKIIHRILDDLLLSFTIKIIHTIKQGIPNVASTPQIRFIIVCAVCSVINIAYKM